MPFVHLNLFVITSFTSKAKVHSENDLFVTAMQEKIVNMDRLTNLVEVSDSLILYIYLFFLSVYIYTLRKKVQSAIFDISDITALLHYITLLYLYLQFSWTEIYI